MLKALLISYLIFASETVPIREGFGNERTNVDVLTKIQASQLFSEFRNNPNIPLQYVQDGCFARATEMTRIAEKQGITLAKIFIEGSLRATAPKYANSKLRFDYHVAAIAVVNVNGNATVMVFDPVFFNEPVAKDVWQKRFLEKGEPKAKIKETYYGSRFQVYPRWWKTEQPKYSWTSYDLEDHRNVMEKLKKLELEVRNNDNTIRENFNSGAAN
jgi:hypothetical protein